MAKRICEIDGCNAVHRARGMCHRHYERWRCRMGGVPTNRSQRPFIERLVEKIEVQGDCWIWQRARDDRGYGKTWDPHRRRHAYAHRSMYEQLVGDIPPGLELDHLCRQPSCVNPDHLDPVTRSVNISRGVSWQANKTHCVRGHPYAGANLRIGRRPDGGYGRICRACKTIREGGTEDDPT